MDSPLTLLEINGVRRQVPMDHRMAVGMKVQTFLANGGSSEHKWPEGRVERLANLVTPSGPLRAIALIALETQREPSSEPAAFHIDGSSGGGHSDVVRGQRNRTNTERSLDHLRDVCGGLLSGRVGLHHVVTKNVDILVKH